MSDELNNPTASAEELYKRACEMTLEQLEKDIEFLGDIVYKARERGQQSRFVANIQMEHAIMKALFDLKIAEPHQKDYYRNILNNVIEGYIPKPTPLAPTPIITNPNFQSPYKEKRNSA